MSPSIGRSDDPLDAVLDRQANAVYTPGQGLPLDLPFDTDQPRPSAQVSGRLTGRRGTNTPLSSSSSAGAASVGMGPAELSRVSRRRLEQLAAHMPERDHTVLRLLAEHRYLTTTQIKRFVCVGHASDTSAARTARYITNRLSRTSLIRALGRRIGGSKLGSSATIWQLSPAGARLVRDGEGHWRPHEPSPRFLRHCLAVADVHLAVRDTAHQNDSVSSGQHIHVETEPDCWRRFTGSGGEPRWLQPDLYARITSAEFIDRWFIEVDLATESLPALVRKCQIYQDYYASGSEQATHRGFPLVLWVFTDPERIDRLRRQVLRSRNLTSQMFRFAYIAHVAQILENG